MLGILRTRLFKAILAPIVCVWILSLGHRAFADGGEETNKYQLEQKWELNPSLLSSERTTNLRSGFDSASGQELQENQGIIPEKNLRQMLQSNIEKLEEHDESQEGADQGYGESAAVEEDPSLGEETPKKVKGLPSGFSASSGVSSQALSLPDGASTMSGMGESFTASLNTGGGSFSVPVVLPPGRRGLQPSLGFSYSTGAGNGPLGWGWSLGVMFISRQGDKGLPRYDRTDRFIFNGGQELVQIAMPEDEAWPTGEWNPQASGFEIEYYRSRTEGVFMRFFYNRALDRWLMQDRQGNHYYYGEDADSRVSGEEGTYQWSITRLADVRRALGEGGNDVQYVYTRDGGSLYIKDVYWNSYQQEYGTLEKYQHNVHFVYEERADRSNTYVAGFRLEQNLRIKRIEVSSFDKAPSGKRDLTRVYLMTYASASESIHSRLVELQTCGRDWLEAGGGTCMPPLHMFYSEIADQTNDGLGGSQKIPGFGHLNEQVKSLTSSPDLALDDPNVTLLDVNQDGLSDVFVTRPEYYGSEHAAIINDGLDGLDADQNLVEISNPAGWSLTLDNLNVSIMDIDGSGNADLLHMPHRQKYHYYRLSGRCDLEDNDCSWVDSGEIPLNTGIDFTANGNDIRTVDVNNDHLIDIVRTTGTRMEHWLNLSAYPGYAGQFGRIDEAGHPVVHESFETCLLHRGKPMQFHDGDLQFGDMNGDGLTDLVHVQSGSIAYWPGRGYGRWGEMPKDCRAGEYAHNAEIVMGGTPYFSNLDNEGVMLSDVNGDGLTDIVQVRFNAVDLWLNRGNDSFTSRHIINDTPMVRSGEYAKVTLADINGSGTADIVWGDAGGWKYLDLGGYYRDQDWNGGLPAGLLEQIDNALGGSTYIEYATTTELMVDAREAGESWETVVPMPMTVVKKMTTTDHLEEVGGDASVYTNEYVYRDPYFDAHEAEFKGFSYGESWDRDVDEGLASCNSESIKRGEAPLLSRQWFHRGIRPECMEPPLKAGWGYHSAACNAALHTDNPFLGLTGATIKTEAYSPCTGEIKSASLSQAEVRKLFDNVSFDPKDDRQVWYVSPNQGLNYSYKPEDTLLGDGTPETYDVVRVLDENGDVVLSETSTFVPSSPDGTFHRVGGWTETDDHGYPAEAKYFGFHRYSSSPLYKYADCDQYSQHFNVEFDPSTWVHVDRGYYMTGPIQSESGAQCENHCTAERPCGWISKEYAADGSVGYGELWRSRTTYWDDQQGQTAPKSIITNWKEYNDYGQLLVEYAGCPSDNVSECHRHTENVYDNLDDGDVNYSAHIRKEISHVPDAAVQRFEFNAKWDAGFGAIFHMHSASGAQTEIEFDALGRVSKTYGLDPRSGELCKSKPSKEHEYHYETAPMAHLVTRQDVSSDYCGDVAPGPTSHIQHIEETRTWVDGLGRPYASVTSGDDHLGSESRYPYMINGIGTLNKKGATVSVCEKMPIDVMPSSPDELLELQYAAHQSLSAAMSTGKWNCDFNEFDAWGRPTFGYSPDGTMSKAEYEVDSGRAYDHLDLTEPCHDGTYASERVDGFGRVVEKITRHSGSCDGGSSAGVIERWTQPTFDALGNPLVVERFEIAAGEEPDSATEIVTRRFVYDSVGRMRENIDMNFGRWQYMYDDIGQLTRTINPTGGTVDYRYDRAGRLTGEDHTGDGVDEVSYYFDAYPGDAVLGLTGLPGWSGYPSGYPVTATRLIAVKDQSGVSVSASDHGSFAESWTKIIRDPAVYHWESALDGAGRQIYAEDPDGHRSSQSYYQDGTGHGSFWTDDVADGQKYQILAESRQNMFDQTEWVKYGNAAKGTAEIESWSGFDPVTHRVVASVAQRRISGDVATIAAFGYQYNQMGLLTGIVDWRGRAFGSGHQTDLQQMYLGNVSHPAQIGNNLPGHHAASMPASMDNAMAAPNASEFNTGDLFAGYSTTGWPAGVAPSDAVFSYDTLYQLRAEDREYAAVGGVDGPMGPGGRIGRRAESLNWDYDWLGSMTGWEEESGDASAPVSAESFGRALGTIVNGHQLNLQGGCNINALATGTTIPSNCRKPEAVYFAHNLDQVDAGRGTCIWAKYDAGGRMTEQRIRTGCSTCEYADGAGYMTASCAERPEVGSPGDIDYQPAIDVELTEYFYGWDSLGQLAQADKVVDGQPKLTMTYVYDAKGNRVIREKSDIPGGVNEVRQDLYLGGYERRQVQLQDTSGNPISVHDHTVQADGYKNIDGTRLVKYSSSIRIQYEHKSGTMDMSVPQMYMTFENHLGSTSAVVDFITGALVEWRTNYAYGADESGWKNADTKYDNAEEPYGFTGKEEDIEVGLHYFGARYYSSYLGRWLSPDPVPMHGSAIANHFGYGGNSPYIYVDPDGRWIHIAIGAAVGFVAGLVTGLATGQGIKKALVMGAIGAATGALVAATAGAASGLAAGGLAGAWGITAGTATLTSLGGGLGSMLVGALASGLVSAGIGLAQSYAAGASHGQAWGTAGISFGASMLSFGLGAAWGGGQAINSVASFVGASVKSAVIGAGVSAITTLANVAIQTGGDFSKADWDQVWEQYAINAAVSAGTSALAIGLGSLSGHATKDGNKVPQEDQELAALSDHVYDTSNPVPEGYRMVDPAEVGMNLNQFENSDTGFKAALYQNNDTGEYVLAYRGSVDGKSYTNGNIPQGAGMGSAQHSQAMKLAVDVKSAVGGNLVITGHSLGGSLAAAAAIVSETKAVTFNAAGLHENTVAPYNKDLSNANNLIKNYSTSGDMLTQLQNAFFFMPKAAGQQVRIFTTYSSNILDQHFRPSVINAVKH